MYKFRCARRGTRTRRFNVTPLSGNSIFELIEKAHGYQVSMPSVGSSGSTARARKRPIVNDPFAFDLCFAYATVVYWFLII